MKLGTVLVLTMGLLLGFGPFFCTAAEEQLTNASVIELQNMGMSDEIIVQKIQTTPGAFDTSLSGLKQLKDASLSDTVIKAILLRSAKQSARTAAAAPVMSHEPLVPHKPGLWYYREQGGEGRMFRVKPQVGGRSSGWNKKSRIELYSATAELQVSSPRPVFYYYETPAESLPDEAVATTPIAEELVLARMEARIEKNDRRLAVGKDGMFGDKKSGLDPKAFIQMKVERAAEGIHRISPVEDLPAGEYCLINRKNANREALKYKEISVYDFGLKR